MEKETKHTPGINAISNLLFKTDYEYLSLGECKAAVLETYVLTLDELQTELSEMKKENTSLQSENTRLKSELLHRDVTVLPQKDLEFEEMKASLQSEIDRLNQENEELKDNYEGMTSHCKYLTEINVFNMAFDKADEHWRKAHKVEEGENFIDWYLRYQAAEREADRKQLSEMKKEREELIEACQLAYNELIAASGLIPITQHTITKLNSIISRIKK